MTEVALVRKVEASMDITLPAFDGVQLICVDLDKILGLFITLILKEAS